MKYTTVQEILENTGLEPDDFGEHWPLLCSIEDCYEQVEYTNDDTGDGINFCYKHYQEFTNAYDLMLQEDIDSDAI